MLSDSSDDRGVGGSRSAKSWGCWGFVMRIVVDFQEESLEFEIPPERVVASWRGPEALGPSNVSAAIGDALEHPRDFPPLRQMIVPGDRVAIAFDSTIPQPRSVLDALVEVLGRAGVGPETITVVAPSRSAVDPETPGAFGGTIEVHDPDDRARIAYLASTREGRR